MASSACRAEAGATPRLADDDARVGPGPRADPRIDPDASGGWTCSTSNCCSRSSRCSAASCRRTSPSQRTILPELVGEDEKRMSQANSVIEGGTALAALLGPALAGVLIPFIGAPNVLYVDAATYLVAFVLVLVFVPRRKAVAAAVPARGARGAPVRHPDRLLGADRRRRRRRSASSAAGMSAGLPVYAYDEFGGSARIAGLFYAALGAGAVVGSVAAVLAVSGRAAPARRRSAILAFAVPLWVLPFLPPWPVVVRRAVRRDALHAARERPADRRPDGPHARRSPREGHDGGRSPSARSRRHSASSWRGRCSSTGASCRSSRPSPSG